MSMSALLSALRGAGRQHLTASTVAARQAVTGSHVFRIQGYTRLLKTRPSGTAVTSTAFRVGGHNWQIKCYPNGESKESDQYMSLYLENLRGGGATARFALSVVDGAGTPSFTRNENLRLFAPSTCNWGWEKFVRNDRLEEGKHLVDDCVTVLCDVTIGDLLPLHAEEVSDLHLGGGRLPEAMRSKEKKEKETADVTVMWVPWRWS